MFSWDLFVAIGWAIFAFVTWIDPRDKMPKSITILLMLILASDYFINALEKAYS